MKVIVAVALFAFVAVQVCQAAPRPDDDKKEEVAVSPPAVSAAEAPAAEVKSEAESPVSSDAASKAEVPLAAPAPEDKKE